MPSSKYLLETVATLREVTDKLAVATRNTMTSEAQLVVVTTENKHLKHKVARAEEHIKALRDQINDELSHHARYNAVKAEAKEFLDESNRAKLLAQARTRAEKVLAGFLRDQEAKYEEFDEQVTSRDTANEQEMARQRKALKKAKKDAFPDQSDSDDADEEDDEPHPGTLGVKAPKPSKPKAEPKANPKPSAKKPEAADNETKKPANGGKAPKATIAKKKDAKPAKAKDEKPKRKGVTMPRARFIKDMTPMYNKEKDKATAKAKEQGKEDFKFPGLFEWITEPWRNLDPAVKKRKYEDPYEAEKKQRDREEGGGGDEEEEEANSKKAAKATKKAKVEEEEEEKEEEQEEEDDAQAQEQTDAADSDDNQEEDNENTEAAADSDDDKENEADDNDEDEVPAVEDDEEE